MAQARKTLTSRPALFLGNGLARKEAFILRLQECVENGLRHDDLAADRQRLVVLGQHRREAEDLPPAGDRGRASLPPTFRSPAGVAGAPQQQSGGSNGNRGSGAAAARRRTLP